MSAQVATDRPANGAKSDMARVLARRDFRLLWLGQATSLVGDQFALIALPWLVLRLTGDPLALGAVLAVTGIPRAALMLVGGAITDRFSARTVMLVSDVIRLALVAGLAALVLAGAAQMWMVYLFSLAFGVVSGLFQPASLTMVPNLLPPAELQAGNAVYQGTLQLTGFVGPALAGAVIGWFAHGATQGPAELTGIGLAFAIDAVTFVASVLTLWALQAPPPAAPATDPAGSVWAAIGAGVRYVWHEPPLRLLILLLSLANLFFSGAVLVGIPVLADTRLPEGALAYGLIMSGFAGGNLLGILAAGSLPKPSSRRLRLLFVALLAAFGLAQLAFAWVNSTWLAFGLLFAVALGNGYLMITIFTILQRITPRPLLGRMMSLMLFTSAGLLPLSQAAAGAISRWSLPGLFVISGALLLLLAGWTLVQPGLRQLADLLAQPAAG